MSDTQKLSNFVAQLCCSNQQTCLSDIASCPTFDESSN